MRKIRTTSTFLGRLNNVEHDYLHRTCNEVFHQNLSIISPAGKSYEQYRKAYLREDTLLMTEWKMEETKPLALLHKKRKRLLAILNQTVKLGIYSEDVLITNAARQLAFLLSTYKDAGRKPYGESTDLTINLLQDLALPEYAAAIAILRLEPAIARLSMANELFDSLYRERSIKSFEKHLPHLVAIRRMVDMNFLKLADEINALLTTASLVGGNPALAGPLEGVVRKISAYILQSQQVYRRRMKIA